MGRAPCCDKTKVKRGPWSPDEDTTLKNYLQRHGGCASNWIALPLKAGLRRCGKSCRLRWLNYLRPDIKHGGFTEEEDNIILTLYSNIGSRWSVIASQLQGRTDNDVKNYWNTKLKKKLFIKPNNDNNNNNNNNINNGDHSTNNPNDSMNFTSSIPTTSSGFVSKALGPYYYGNSTNQDEDNTNSIDLVVPYYDHHPNYQQKIIQETPVFRPIQIPLPRLVEVSDFGNESQNISSVSQEVSSVSGSFSVENNYEPWSVNGDFPYDLLDGFDFQDRISEVCPNSANSLYNQIN